MLYGKRLAGETGESGVQVFSVPASSSFTRPLSGASGVGFVRLGILGLIWWGCGIMRVRYVRSVHHRNIDDEAGAIDVNADVATALSGGLVGCITLAQVPNGHLVAIELLVVDVFNVLRDDVIDRCPLSGSITIIASAPDDDGAGGRSGGGGISRTRSTHCTSMSEGPSSGRRASPIWSMIASRIWSCRRIC